MLRANPEGEHPRQSADGEHTITLTLGEATMDQLRIALAGAQAVSEWYDRHGGLHSWHGRVAAIEAEIARRA